MRKPIDKSQCAEIGYIKKTHCINGELLINFEEGFEPIFDEAEFLFFEIDGLPVPFFLEELEQRSNNSIVVKFKFIDSKEEAQRFVGAKILVDEEMLPFDEESFHYMHLKGFQLSDSTRGEIGKIIAIDDYSGNFVLTVEFGKSEILLPLNEELIVAFDRENRTIKMDYPQGLFELGE
jgi:16S rRNA processing protein RimM